jgi:hypothetical protein
VGRGGSLSVPSLRAVSWANLFRKVQAGPWAQRRRAAHPEWPKPLRMTPTPHPSAVGETESLSFGATAICSYCTAGLELSNRSRKVSHNARLRSCIKRRVVLDPRRPTVLDFDQNPDAFAVERRFSPPNEQGVLWHLKAGIDRLTSSSSSHYS